MNTDLPEDGDHRLDAVLIVRDDEAPEPAEELFVCDKAVKVWTRAHEFIQQGEGVEHGDLVLTLEPLPQGKRDGLAAGDHGRAVRGMRGVAGAIEHDVDELDALPLALLLGDARLGRLVDLDDNLRQERVQALGLAARGGPGDGAREERVRRVAEGVRARCRDAAARVERARRRGRARARRREVAHGVGRRAGEVAAAHCWSRGWAEGYGGGTVGSVESTCGRNSSRI
ncbi:unnamed protein product [Chondrus crispus]|uniref:Uncharacterized protein n=1 Tax=Chondrus crispus TaxID=2769 RepID=R7Q7T0_CHOCR|nr:unnamed protein product [Chondrus crispus]CDF33505.1 unnamed protein product [Chondrus crispus]|eukprot:XP_005713308.1 unnamed protein product [Chondrus crispus]